MKSIFRCQKLNAEISIERCIRNQREALEFFGAEASRFQSCPCSRGEELRMAERKCESCGRLIYSGHICSVCKRTAEAGALVHECRKVSEPLPFSMPESEEKMGKKIICRNCGREKTLSQNGLCGGCSSRIKGKPKEEIEAILAQAKEDFNNPHYKPNYKPNYKPTRPASIRKAGAESDHPSLHRALEKHWMPVEFHVPKITTVKSEMINIEICTADDKAAIEFIQDQARKNRRSIDQQIYWMIECHMKADREQKRVSL